MRTQIKLDVELDSGETYQVIADQRDLALREAQDGVEGMFTSVRYLAWSAAVRAKRYAGSWEQFNTTDCAEVVSPGDEAEAGDGLDPGRKGQSAGD